MADNANRPRPPKGQPFRPGQSGNPGGRPKQEPGLTQLARKYTEEAIRVVASVLKDPEAKHADRLKAAEILLERGHGRAHQSVDFEAEANTLVGLLALGFTAAVPDAGDGGG